VAQLDGGEQRAGQQRVADSVQTGVLLAVPLRGGDHVIDNQHAAGGEGGDGTVEALHLAAVGVGEDEIEAPELAQDRERISAPQCHEVRPVTLGGQRGGARVFFHRDDRDVRPR